MEKCENARKIEILRFPGESVAGTILTRVQKAVAYPDHLEPGEDLFEITHPKGDQNNLFGWARY